MVAVRTVLWVGLLQLSVLASYSGGWSLGQEMRGQPDPPLQSSARDRASGESSADHADDDPSPSGYPSDDQRDGLLERVAPLVLAIAERAMGLDDPQVVGGSIAQGAVSQQYVFAFKLLDERGTRLPDDMLIVEDDLALALRGKVHPDLAQLLRLILPDEPVPVLIWCRVPQWIPLPDRPAPDALLTPEEQEALDQELLEVAQLRNLVHAEPVVDALGALAFQIQG